MNTKFLKLFGLVIILGLGFFVFSLINKHKEPPLVENSPSFSPLPSPSPSSSPKFSPSPRVSPTPTVADGGDFSGLHRQTLVPTSVPQEKLTGPGSCELSGGRIVFLEPNFYAHKQAFLSYKNIDSPARLIFWRILPDDGALLVGPNIFADLELPEGRTDLSVTQYKKETAKHYTLSASVAYGIFKNGAVVGTAEAVCKGEIKVDFNY